jgi:glycosyltransferase involved in cell wall biosynthesis
LEYNDFYLSKIGEGTAFASEFITDLQEVNYQKLDNTSADVLRDLYVFDYWVCNADRNLTEQGGNPNLFYKQSSLDLIVLDHNLAFYNNFLKQKHSQLHACKRFWLAQFDFDSQQKYEEKIGKSLQHWDDLISKIPNDWKVEIAGFDGFIN